MWRMSYSLYACATSKRMSRGNAKLTDDEWHEYDEYNKWWMNVRWNTMNDMCQTIRCPSNILTSSEACKIRPHLSKKVAWSVKNQKSAYRWHISCIPVSWPLLDGCGFLRIFKWPPFIASIQTIFYCALMGPEEGIARMLGMTRKNMNKL